MIEHDQTIVIRQQRDGRILVVFPDTPAGIDTSQCLAWRESDRLRAGVFFPVVYRAVLDRTLPATDETTARIVDSLARVGITASVRRKIRATHHRERNARAGLATGR